MLIRSLIILTILLFLFVTCTNNTGEKKSNSSNTQKPSLVNCYKYSNSGDTIILKLIHVGKSITGTLAYEMPQKNTSKGTILGYMDGDLLVATFTPFVDSTTPRQIAFKLVSNYFIEGTGETYIDNGRVLFKNRNQLNFNDANKLNEFDCQ